LDTLRSQRRSDSSINSINFTEAALFGFFISPNLSIDYDEALNPRLFCPSQRYLTAEGKTFERKYLRILVKNTGFVKATNCEAKMRIVSSNDTKQLVWDRAATSGVLREISLQKNIRARKGEELVHIVFSDSRFTEMSKMDYRIFASAATMESVVNQQILSLEDGFGLENFDIEISVLSEEGAFCKSTFQVRPNMNHSGLSMTKLSEQSGGRWSRLRRKKSH
jgi:hypothetical protein